VNSLNYKEVLPDLCPPNEAKDIALNNVCRFLPFSPPDSDENYKSHAELGKRVGSATECKARSCSLFRYTDVAKQAMKIGFFRKMKVAVLNIPVGAGKHLHGNNGHIDFWVYSNFKPANSVVHLCRCADDVEQAVENG